MSEAIVDPFAFTNLTDHVLQQIKLSESEELKQVCNCAYFTMI